MLLADVTMRANDREFLERVITFRKVCVEHQPANEHLKVTNGRMIDEVLVDAFIASVFMHDNLSDARDRTLDPNHQSCLPG